MSRTIAYNSTRLNISEESTLRVQIKDLNKSTYQEQVEDYPQQELFFTVHTQGWRCRAWSVSNGDDGLGKVRSFCDVHR